MMGIGRVPATNKAWLSSNRFNVLPVANAARRRKRENAFIDNVGCAPLFHPRFGLMHRRFFDGVAHKASQRRLESCFNARGIGRYKRVFDVKNPMSPVPASSAELRSSISAVSWSCNAADTSGSRIL